MKSQLKLALACFTAAAPAAAQTPAELQTKTIECVMAEVYKAADSMGLEAADFAQRIRQDSKDAEEDMARAAIEFHDTASRSFSHDSVAEGVPTDTKLTLNVQMERDGQSGEMRVNVRYSLQSKSGRKRTGKNDVRLNSMTGDMDMLETTPAARTCLNRLNRTITSVPHVLPPHELPIPKRDVLPLPEDSELDRLHPQNTQDE